MNATSKDASTSEGMRNPLPFIHLGGTSANDLLMLARDVLDSLRDARHKIQRAAPNARDYLDREHLRAAHELYHARIAYVDSLIAGYTTDAEHACEQLP